MTNTIADGEWRCLGGIAEREEKTLRGFTLVAWSTGMWSVYNDIEKEFSKRGMASDLASAKEAAEKGLREIADAAAKIFAPVLKWHDPCPGDDRLPGYVPNTRGCHYARVGGWLVLAASDKWELIFEELKHWPAFESGGENEWWECLEDNMRAVERALRKLGVQFLTEEEAAEIDRKSHEERA